AEASNSLLKTLEEPPENTILILTTSQKNKLLPTIISRCQLVQFDLLEESEIREALIKKEGVESEQAALVARLANGSFTSAQALLSRDWVSERQEVVGFLRDVLGTQKANLSNTIDRLASSHDRNSLERWLKMLQSWMRDALILQETGNYIPSSVDSNKDVESFVRKFPRANLLSAVEALDRQIALINKNVYLPLILTNLAIDLKNHLSQRSS
ncbi:MAG TPA: hypothetical protein VI704_01125, partial [Bacteroidota bacterium]|nr:hypothetical protein [Bacteroidota bacterium]